jgi:CheY-like chemotaxis protein
MCIEILVVDDLRSAADEYARLISLRTKLESIATDDPNEAIHLLKIHPIKVVILDQRMPQMNGTELYRHLSSIDRFIKVIMLTGEAEANEVGEALKIGFSDYVHKSNLEELPRRVFLQYARYHVDFSELCILETPIVLTKNKKGFPRGNDITIGLVKINPIEEEYIFPGSWMTIKQLRCGEHIREIDKIEITKRYIHESEDEAKLASKLGIDIPILQQLKYNLESVISSKHKESLFAESRNNVEVSRDYNLPQEPTDPDERHIVSRHFQRAPVYRAFRCLLLKKCDCCGQKEPFPLMLYQLTSKVATRQRDFLNDGTKRDILTGIEVY